MGPCLSPIPSVASDEFGMQFELSFQKRHYNTPTRVELAGCLLRCQANLLKEWRSALIAAGPPAQFSREFVVRMA